MILRITSDRLPPTSQSPLTAPNTLDMTPQEKTHRSRLAAGCDQQGLCAGEVDSAWAPEHLAFVVGAAAIGGGAGGDLRADGG
jgi:hypothetical protein